MLVVLGWKGLMIVQLLLAAGSGLLLKVSLAGVGLHLQCGIVDRRSTFEESRKQVRWLVASSCKPLSHYRCNYHRTYLPWFPAFPLPLLPHSSCSDIHR